MGLREDLNRYTPRKEQEEALEFVKKIHSSKADNKFYLMNLPVGTGKSHLALMISQWFLNTISQDSKVDIITPGKILQDQYDEEYESITNLKGKDNYNCSSYSCSCAQGKEFNKLNKTTCDFCPYDSAKEAYIGGRVSLTNFHLYLIHSLYTPKVLENRDSRLLIVDECLHPDSYIKMSNGEDKKIKEVKEGEYVLTLNEKTSEYENKEVEYVYKNLSKNQQMYELEMEDGSILRITGNHKVRLKNGDWRKVEELTEDDDIINI